MAAETNTIMQGDVVTRVADFNIQFVEGLKKLTEALGITRKIPVQEGATLKQIVVTGTLQNGNVAEGELIPLFKYEAEEVPVGEVKLNKWRKGTTAEAILKGGYDQAVGATTDKMAKDIQNHSSLVSRNSESMSFVTTFLGSTLPVPIIFIFRV